MAGRLASLLKRAVLPRRHGFVRDDSGVTAVEFGLLALPFFSIIGAIMETSIVFMAGNVLDSAVHDSSRLIRTGQVQTAKLDAAAFKKNICDRVYGLFPDCINGIYLEVKQLGSFNATNITPPVDWNCKSNCGWTRTESFSPGAREDIVLVQAYYKWPIMLSIGDFTLANVADRQRLLGSATVFRNEPF